MKYFVSVILGLLIVTYSIAETTIITVWGMSITPEEKGSDLIVRQFEKENPNIKVRLLNMGAGAMSPQKLMTAIVGGSPPDLIRQDRFTIADWGGRGAFRELDDLIERDKNSDPRTPKREQYYPAAWDEAKFDGKQYGIPIGADNRVLHWSPIAFKKKEKQLIAAGLDPNRPPRTWSELLAYSKAMTEFNKDGTIKLAGFIPNYGNAWLYLYAFQNNAEFISSDGRTCTLDSPASREALEFMVEGYKILGGYDNARKFESGFRGGENDPFAIGQVGMVINGDWMISNYSRYSPKAQFLTAPAPVPDDRYFKRGRFANEKDTFITWAGGFSWSMPRGVKNVEAAWKFLKFVTSYEGRQLNVKGQSELDMARGRKYIPRMEAQVQMNDWLRDQYASGTSQYDAAMRMHMSLMDRARMRPATFVGQKLWDEHIRALERACRGEVLPEIALKESQEKVQGALDEFYSKDTLPKVDIRVPVGAVFALVVIGLVGYVLSLFRRKQERVSLQETKAGYLFISPWIVGFLAFTLGPMVASFVFAFMQYDVLNPARFAGVQNFVDLFGTDRELLFKSFWNVGYLAVVGIPLGMVTGLSIALLLNTGVRMIRFYRTAFYLPSITPQVATVFSLALGSES